MVFIVIHHKEQIITLVLSVKIMIFFLGSVIFEKKMWNKYFDNDSDEIYYNNSFCSNCKIIFDVRCVLGCNGCTDDCYKDILLVNINTMILNILVCLVLIQLMNGIMKLKILKY